MAIETHKDDFPLCSGTHTGANGASILTDTGKNFDVFVTIGVDCHNTSQGTNGAITAVTKNTATATSVTWDTGDLYEIYCTATKDSYISSIKTTKILGRKWTDYYQDKNEEDLPDGVFGPGQPDMTHK